MITKSGARQIGEETAKALVSMGFYKDEILTIEELAQMLKFSVKWVRKHLDEIPHFMLGGELRFRLSAINKMIDRQ